MASIELTLRIARAIGDVADAEWDACANSAASTASDAPVAPASTLAAEYNPFISHDFLSSLELSDSVRPRAGWEPKSAAARLRQAAVAAGRDPATLSITVFNAPPDPAALETYRAAGIQRVLLEVPDSSRDEVLRLLDRNAALISASDV